MDPNIIGVSSGILTVDAPVSSGPSVLHSATIRLGTTAGLFILADGVGGSTIWQFRDLAVAAAGDDTVHHYFDPGLYFPNGIYYNFLSGTGMEVILTYSKD